MKLIYIGDHFYHASGTMMSSIYHETGERCHWGKVQCVLQDGDTVEIRQPTQKERDFYEAILLSIKQDQAKPANEID